MAKISVPIVIGCVLGIALHHVATITMPNVYGSAMGSIDMQFSAERFIVKDKDGKEWGKFGILSNGRPGLSLWNKDRSAGAILQIDDHESPRFALQNAEGNAVVDIGMLDRSFPVFILRGPDGKRRLGSVVADNGSVGVAIYDNTQKERLLLRVAPDGAPTITLRNSQGARQIMLGIETSGAATLVLSDPTEQIRLKSSIGGNEPVLKLLGPKDEERWSAFKD